MRRINPADVVRNEPIEKLARIVTGDFDDAAVGKQRSLHGRDVPGRSVEI
jgi:hypothetical protein